MSERRLVELYDLDAQFFVHWRKRESRRHPPEPALRSEKVPNRKAGKCGPSKLRVYVVADVKAILGGGETKYPGSAEMTRGTWRAGQLDDLAYQRWLKSILADGPQTVDAVLAAAREARLAVWRVKRVKVALGVKMARVVFGGPWYWCLPGQSPPSVPPSSATAPSVSSDAGRQTEADTGNNCTPELPSASAPSAPESSPETSPEPDSQERRRRGRGRPPGISSTTAQKREAIRADLADGRLATAEIARKHHVTPGYVRNVRAGQF